MEAIVFDHEPYPGIDFDTNLETIKVARKPGQQGCSGKAKVNVRYSYLDYNGAYKDKNAWNPNSASRIARDVKLPKHSKVPKDDSLPSDVKSTIDARIASHGKIHQYGNLTSNEKIPAKESKDAKRYKMVHSVQKAVRHSRNTKEPEENHLKTIKGALGHKSLRLHAA